MNHPEFKAGVTYDGGKKLKVSGDYMRELQRQASALAKQARDYEEVLEQVAKHDPGGDASHVLARYDRKDK